MDKINENYRSEVWQFLDNLEPEIYYKISSLCVPENKHKFIRCIKSYMDVKIPFQGYITFNKDYSVLYKTHPITFKKNLQPEKK